MAVTFDRVIKEYVKLRDEKAAIEAEMKERVSDVKNKLGKLEAYLLQKLSADGSNSVKTDHGTAFITTTSYASVANWSAVLQFVKDQDAYHMLEKRVSKSAVVDYMEQHNEVPPGVEYGTRLSVNVRKPNAR